MDTKVHAQEQKTEKASRTTFKNRFLVFCRKHSFRPINVVLLLVVIAVFVCVGVFSCVKAVTSIGSRTVKLGLENIGELATQAGYYTNVQVITGSREVFGFQVPFTQSKYVYSYDGTIRAGIDFSKVKISVDEIKHIITIEMPQVRIISNDVDPDSLQVYDETKNIFTPLKLADVNQATKEMREEAEANAIENGLLDGARSNAESLVTCFVSSMYDMQVYDICFDWQQE